MRRPNRRQFGGGVFSRALATGLRGSADLDGDGAISLEEAYRHAFAETVVGTAASGSAIQRPELHTELADGRSVTLTPGMSYQVADGAEPHRSSTETGARLFIVD